MEKEEEKMLENQGEDEFGEGLKAKNRVKETKVITKGISESFLGVRLIFVSLFFGSLCEYEC